MQRKMIDSFFNFLYTNRIRAASEKGNALAQHLAQLIILHI